LGEAFRVERQVHQLGELGQTKTGNLENSRTGDRENPFLIPKCLTTRKTKQKDRWRVGVHSKRGSQLKLGQEEERKHLLSIKEAITKEDRGKKDNIKEGEGGRGIKKTVNSTPGVRAQNRQLMEKRRGAAPPGRRVSTKTVTKFWLGQKREGWGIVKGECCAGQKVGTGHLGKRRSIKHSFLQCLKNLGQ